MRAPISVIVPTLNAESSLHQSMSCLMEGIEVELIREVIVSDGGSSDNTVVIAQEWGAELVFGEPSRGGQLQRGCRAAQGDWLLVLHADTVLSPGWTRAVVEHLKSDKAGWFSLQFEGGGAMGRLVAIWANIRSRLGLPYGDQGLLVPRALYESTGGYLDIPLMEDVAISRALKGQLRQIDSVAITSPEKYQKQGWLRRGTKNMWTLARYFVGVDPKDLAASYRR